MSDEIVQNALVYTTSGEKEDLRRLRYSLASFRKFMKEPCDVYVLSNHPGWISDAPDVTTIDISKFVDEFKLEPPADRPTAALGAFFVLFIPLVEELKKYPRVVYLDTDTEVRSERVIDLFKVPFRGHEIIAAYEDWGSKQEHNKNLLEKMPKDVKEALGPEWVRLVGARPHVNTGVLAWDNHIIDLRHEHQWYRDKFQMYRKCLRTGATLGMRDQPFINLFMDLTVSLSVQYNQTNLDDTLGTVVRHFADTHKSLYMDRLVNEWERKQGVK